MKFFGKALGLTLAALALSSCGGGGGDGGAVLPPQSGKIELSATTTTLPVNVWGYQPTQYGNPTQAEVTITWRYADGTLVTGHDVAVSIAPTNVAVLSCLVDGDACKDGNALFGSMTIKGINGQATIFVNSFTTAGTATMTVSATDPNTNRTVSNTLKFTVTSGVGPLPANITLTPTPTNVYLPSSGGNSASSIKALVVDGAGQLIPDPASGNNAVDNVQMEIVGNAGDAILTTNSAGGQSTGTKVTTHTVHGAATVSFQAGAATNQGVVQIKATADRADNNVSNGIQDPVTATTNIIVSDGKLFSLVISSPTTNAISVNPVSGNITSDSGTTPPDPDGTYSLTVSVTATDRQGAPVVPGTPIQFGIVDAPMTGFPDNGSGSFLISGGDGNPKEAATLFTAPNGRFRTLNAQPGDTLLIFAKDDPLNRDLESSRQVGTILGETSLNVTYPFNPNEDSNGVSADHGAVLPYVIGHASEGTIGASAVTNEKGIAHTTLNYPVSRIGKGALIWAQGAGDVIAATGRPRLVTDISGGGFPGVAPGQLAVSQTPLPGNTEIAVTVCFYDALGAPIQGAGIGFAFSNLGLGSGSIDNKPTSGVMNLPTGTDGCTTGTMKTNGLTGGGSGDNAPTVTFSAGPGTEALPVPIVVSGNLLLQASPSSLGGNGGNVTLKLTDASGNPVPGAQIVGECEEGAGIGSAIAATNTAGTTTAAITADLDAYGTVNKAKCTFKTGLDSGPTAVVNLTGVDLCVRDPNNSQCDSAGTNDTVSVIIVRGAGVPATVTGSVVSNPAGLTCNLGANQSTTLCSGIFPDAATVLFSATAAPAAGRTFTFSGDCNSLSGNSASLTVAAGATCTVTVH